MGFFSCTLVRGLFMQGTNWSTTQRKRMNLAVQKTVKCAAERKMKRSNLLVTATWNNRNASFRQSFDTAPIRRLCLIAGKWKIRRLHAYCASKMPQGIGFVFKRILFLQAIQLRSQTGRFGALLCVMKVVQLDSSVKDAWAGTESASHFQERISSATPLRVQKKIILAGKTAPIQICTDIDQEEVSFTLTSPAWPLLHSAPQGFSSEKLYI